MNKISNVLWGLCFIIVGFILGLNALDITSINIFFNGWWTLFIIVPCFIGLFKDNDKTNDLIGLIIGLALLLGCRNIIDFEIIWKLLFPMVLVLIGLSFIFKNSFSGKVKKEIKKLNKSNQKEYCACFSGQTIDFSNEKFDGAEANAVFGGIKLDLKNAIIDNDVVINASSIFGGITIYVSENVNVKITSNSVFGGVSDERKNKTNENERTIYINATAMFGGIEIK